MEETCPFCYQGITITRLPKDGPADLAGVQAGNRVTEVDELFVAVEGVLLLLSLNQITQNWGLWDLDLGLVF